MRKIYLLPNIVTTANMFCGFYAIIAAIQNDYILSAWLIVAAGIFDMLDGRIARLTKATSQFGVEYDSLSDLVSFGVAPGILLYQWALNPFDRLGWLAGFLFMTCGALRLARFNVNCHAVPKGYFQGLPIPMPAGLIATFIIFKNSMGWSEPQPGFVLFMTLFLSSLMVSTVRFPSFKELDWHSRSTFGYLAVGILVMILIAAKPEIMLFLILASYISLSLVWNLYRILVKGGSSTKEKASSTPYERRV